MHERIAYFCAARKLLVLFMCARSMVCYIFANFRFIVPILVVKYHFFYFFQFFIFFGTYFRSFFASLDFCLRIATRNFSNLRLRVVICCQLAVAAPQMLSKPILNFGNFAKFHILTVLCGVLVWRLKANQILQTNIDRQTINVKSGSCTALRSQMYATYLKILSWRLFGTACCCVSNTICCFDCLLIQLPTILHFDNFARL